MIYDVIIIGAGHNGLTCAGYLARAGLKVKLLEKRDIVGGAAVTEEFYPGFRNSICSYIVSTLSPYVIKELELERYGMELIERASGMMSALPDGRHLIAGESAEKDAIEIAKFNPQDVSSYEKFSSELSELAKIFRTIINKRPPNIGGGFSSWLDFFKFGNYLRGLSSKQKEKLMEIMTCSLGDYLDRRFEGEELKGLLAGDGATGNFLHPYAPTTALNLLHHEYGNINGQSGKWWHSKGGMGGITQAMLKSAKAYGAEIETGVAVKELILEENSNSNIVKGVVLEDGRTVKAMRVVANCTAKILFTELMNIEDLPNDFASKIKNFRYLSGSFKINVALSELPRISSLSGLENPKEEMKRSIIISPSIKYMEQAYHDARMRGFALRPMVSMNIPTLLDDSLAPEGRHIASLFCQHFNPNLPDGLNWEHIKDEAAEAVIDTVTEIAPNFRGSIIGMQILSPKDLESEFSLTGGDIFHGNLHLDQIFSFRPAVKYANYRTPIENLYLCGSGAHPGGGVSGIAGRLSAKEIIKDTGRAKLKRTK